MPASFDWNTAKRTPRAAFNGVTALLRSKYSLNLLHHRSLSKCTHYPSPSPPPRAAFDGVTALLRSKYPGCGVSVFGSAANALGIRDNNDIDVSLSIAGLEDSREAKGGCAAGRGRRAACVLLLGAAGSSTGRGRRAA